MTARRATLTAVIYFAAGAICSAPLLSRDLSSALTATPSTLLLRVWFFTFPFPLFFAFAYPQLLFAVSARTSPHRNLLLHGLAALGATALFTTLAFPYWKNPFYWENPLGRWHSPALPVLFWTIQAVFLVSALFLLLKNKSTLATLASLLFWPYWLLTVFMNVPRFLGESRIQAAMYFLCFIAGVPFAFAAGTLAYRRRLAHASALIGLVGFPWLYWNVIRNSGWGNVWITFNIPDRAFGYYQPMYADLAILAVGLTIVAAVIAGLRLLPTSWHLRGFPVCERTWPAFAISFVVLAVWFVQSVSPYRIPGAVDYADYPVLQILHVEKDGLQFHEKAIKISSYGGFCVSTDDRRLLQYRFEEMHTTGRLPPEMKERVQALLSKSEGPGRSWGDVKPLRAWHEEGWYVNAGSGVTAYTNGATPPSEYVDLFHEVQRLPQSPRPPLVMKDICLGFCYDPLAGLGFLY